MSIVENSTPESIEKLLVQLASIEYLRDEVLAELLEQYGWVPPAVLNQCGHATRPVFGALDRSNRPACKECVTTSYGVPPRDVIYLERARGARLSDTELAWANRDTEADLAREWSDAP